VREGAGTDGPGTPAPAPQVEEGIEQYRLAAVAEASEEGWDSQQQYSQHVQQSLQRQGSGGPGGAASEGSCGSWSEAEDEAGPAGGYPADQQRRRLGPQVAAAAGEAIEDHTFLTGACACGCVVGGGGGGCLPP
jgi:hypothetical protein